MQGYVDGVKTAYTNPPFAVGEKVVLEKDYYNQGVRVHMNKVVRTVIRVYPTSSMASGWAVEVDGGEPCKHCGLTPASKLRLDSGWFVKYDHRKM